MICIQISVLLMVATSKNLGQPWGARTHIWTDITRGTHGQALELCQPSERRGCRHEELGKALIG